MEGEEECQGCGVVTGGTLEYYLSDYQDHKLCGWCIANWRHTDTRVSREISWKEFKTGRLEDK